MSVRAFRPDDAQALVRLATGCARGHNDFVLNPLWESEEELFAEFARNGIEPAEHLLVAERGDGTVVGGVGFVRLARATTAGLLCPIVAREERGRGLGGELLRAALGHGLERLGIKMVSAGIGTRNRAGFALLLATGFRPRRQYFLMCCDVKPKAPRASAKLEFGSARAEDTEAILEIYASCGFEERSPEAMRAVVADDRRFHAVARQSGRVVAFAELETHWPRRPWVAFVGVDPKQRERGLGSAVLSWSLARLFAQGAESALLLLSPANRTAIRAYEKVGFRRHRTVDVLDKGL